MEARFFPLLPASVREEPLAEWSISVIAGSPHAAGATLGLGVSSLRGNEIELLLRLVEPQTHPLFVQEPEIPTN